MALTRKSLTKRQRRRLLRPRISSFPSRHLPTSSAYSIQSIRRPKKICRSRLGQRRVRYRRNHSLTTGHAELRSRSHSRQELVIYGKPICAGPSQTLTGPAQRLLAAVFFFLWDYALALTGL